MTTRTEQFRVTGPVALRLTTVDADITVQESDGTTLEVSIESAGDLDLSPCTVTFEDGSLVVEVPHLQDPEGAPGFTFSIGHRSFNIGGGHPRLSLTIAAPAGSSAIVKTRSGDVGVEVPLDELLLESTSGEVAVERATSATIRVVSGDLSVESVGEIVASSASGDIHVTSAGRANLKTASGDVTVDSCEGDMTAVTASGDVSVEAVGGAAQVRTGSGDIELDGIRAGRVETHTASGDVNLGVVENVPVWTDVTTVSGDIDNDLSSRGEPQDGRAHVELVVRTVSGDVTLTDD